MEPLGLNIEDSVWKTFLGITDDMFSWQDLRITIAVIFIDFLLQLLKKPSEGVSRGCLQFCYAAALQEYIGKGTLF